MRQRRDDGSMREDVSSKERAGDGSDGGRDGGDGGQDSSDGGRDGSVAAPAEAGELVGTPTPTATDHLDDSRMSIVEHLQELRVRLRNAGLVFVVATVVASRFAGEFFGVLTRPVVEALGAGGYPATFVMPAPGEGVWVELKLAVVLGIVTALPLVFWELWRFVAPGLYRRERRLALTFTAATVLCFVAGAGFGCRLLSPATHLFLLGSAGNLTEAVGVASS